MDQVVTIFISILGSSAVFGFIQFMITRKDNKDDKLDKIVSKLDGIEVNMKSLSDRIDKNDKELRDSLDENKAITARVRILRGADEVMHKMRHSKEWFDQTNEDITYYESYCAKHPDFRNNKAVHAIATLNTVYAKALADNDFL